VVAIAVASLIVEVVLGFTWPEPTPFQQKVVEALDYGWKGGFGFLLGLLSGKQL